jgi:hypothetical protein
LLYLKRETSKERSGSTKPKAKSKNLYLGVKKLVDYCTKHIENNYVFVDKYEYVGHR